MNFKIKTIEGEDNMHSIIATPQFFSAIMRKKAINSILEDYDE